MTQPRRPLDAIGKSFRKIKDSSPSEPVQFLDHESDPLHNFNHEGMAWRIPYFMDVATSKRVASAAVQIMRREQAVFVQDISFFKPGPGTPTAMHQDYASWPFDRKGQINIWIALVDMSPDMGSLQYIEGSHQAGPLGLAGKLDVRATYPELDDRPVGGGGALRAGDARVHWDLTVHGAQANTTDRIREAYVLRFARTDTLYNGIGHPHYDLFSLPIGTGVRSAQRFSERRHQRGGELTRSSPPQQSDPPMSPEPGDKPLRSASWFAAPGSQGSISRSWLRNQGPPPDMFDGTRPVIGICNTWSELTPCNGHFRDLAERVRRGVLEAGGVPMEFPVTSLGETLMRPTAMMFRNLCSMDVEESIRANPLDGVVLLVGCDKTTPALIMGAASCNLPTIVVSGGPMLNGVFRGQRIGSGTYMFRLLDQLRTGEITEDDVLAAEGCMARSAGHCMTMGTASTMAAMVEALGLGLPGNAAIPAADARRSALAQVAGRRAVDMVRENLTMDRILTREAFENAIRVCGAIGGSTNAVIHLIAIAGRIGVPLTLDDWATLGRDIPCLLNLMPSGEYLMEDFYYAGGLQVIMKELGELLHTDALTANGRPSAKISAMPNAGTVRSFGRWLRRSVPRVESLCCAETLPQTARC